MAAPAEQVLETLKAADSDRYLSVLYAPEAKRRDLAALYAFNAEIAAVRDRIREALPGEIRLQWWRDVIAAGTDDAGAGHPVAEALLRAIRDHGLPRQAFQDYLDARIFDLYNDPMPSRTDLEGYCGETASALIQLAAMILDPKEAAAQAELAGHAGCAQAITGLLRLLPIHLTRGQCYLPRDLLAAAGTTPEELVAGGDEGASVRAVAAMAALSQEHLTVFESKAHSLPESLRPAFLPVALSGRYLAAIAKEQADALRRPADIASWRKHWLYFCHATLGWPQRRSTR